MSNKAKHWFVAVLSVFLLAEVAIPSFANGVRGQSRGSVRSNNNVNNDANVNRNAYANRNVNVGKT